jgi:hypothetical protein
MNVYACTGFNGFYPVGTAAIIMARGRKEAAKLLSAELIKIGLDGDVTEEEMCLIDTEHLGVYILLDGDY